MRYSPVIFASLICIQPSSAAVTYIAPSKSDGLGMWAFEAGCAFITSNRIQEVLFTPQDMHIEGGAEGGEIYTFTASRRLGELRWEIGNSVFHPQMELPLTLEIVNEHSRSSFLDYNAAFMMRWVDFPWNEWVQTSFAMGVGLSYSSKVYLMDRATHPNDPDRAHLQIYWPIQWAFGLPSHPKDKVTVFISHQSGGHIFDVGGNNSIGFGYRRDF